MERIQRNGQRVQPLFPGPIQPLFPGPIHRAYRGPAVFVNKTRQFHANTAQRPSYSDVVRGTFVQKPKTQPDQHQPTHHHNHHNRRQYQHQPPHRHNHHTNPPQPHHLNHHTQPRQPHHPNHQTKPRQPPQQQYRTNDPSFARLLKLLYRGTQLRHHANNWGTLPKAVEKKIKDLFEFLTPPVPTDELKSQLDSIRSSLMHDIRTSILTHLNIHSDINNKHLKETTTNETDKEAARGLAERVIRRKYGRKASQQNLDAWLAADLSVIQPTTTTNTSTETPQTTRKRRRDSPPIKVPISNRFSILADEPGSSAVLVDAEPDTNPKRMMSRSPVTNKNENITSDKNNTRVNPTEQTDSDDTWSISSSKCDRILSSQPIVSLTRLSLPNSFQRKQSLNKNVNIHDNKCKSEWKLTIKNTPKTVLVTDSNFRLAQEIPIPEDWEIHVFPGNNFSHTTNILKTATIPTSVENVVLAVGINNKGSNFETSINPDMTKMATEAKSMRQTIHFLGVSTVNPSESIKKINEMAMKIFGEKFIPALPEDQVTISPIDPFNVHHNKITVEKIIKSIKNHLN